jgi:hypothetical protein
MLFSIHNFQYNSRHYGKKVPFFVIFPAIKFAFQKKIAFVLEIIPVMDIKLGMRCFRRTFFNHHRVRPERPRQSVFGYSISVLTKKLRRNNYEIKNEADRYYCGYNGCSSDYYIHCITKQSYDAPNNRGP